MLRDEKAYLSSTYEDLKGIRIKVREQLTRLGIKAVGMEDYCAGEERPLDRCLEDVRSCQLYIGLFGDRYGYVPQGMTKSITELEYETAGNEGIERLLFLIDFPDWAYDHDRGERIIELRKKVSTNHIVKRAKSVDELLLQITDAIMDWRKKRCMRHMLPPDSTVQVFLGILRRQSSEFYRYYVALRGILRTVPPKVKEDDELWPSTLSAVAPPSPGPANIVALEKVEMALSYHCQLLLVGRGGCGKTTFLKHLAYMTVADTRSSCSGLIPLHIELASWPDHCTDLASLIYHEALDQIGAPVSPRLLLLLLDGISEIPSGNAQARIDEIAKWLSKHPEATVIATSREEHQNLGLPSVNILPLNDQGVEEFVRERLGERSRNLLLQINWAGRDTASPRDIVHLARNPFLLKVMCRLYDEGHQTFPRSRAELIQGFTEKLCKRERNKLCNSRSIPDVSVVIEGFTALAVAMLQNRTSQMIDKEFLSKLLPNGLDSETIILFGRRAELVDLKKEERFVKFSHPLLLEYFAAKHFLLHPERIQLVLTKPHFENGIRVPSRHDDVVHTMLTLAPPSSILHTLIEMDPFLAVAAISQLPDPSMVEGEVLEALVKQLVCYIEGDDRELRVSATSAIVQLGPIAVPMLSELLRRHSHWTRRLAVSALSQIPGEKALEGLVASLLDSNRWVRRDATRALQSVDDESRPLLERICRRIGEMETVVREKVGSALISCWTGFDADLAELVRAQTGIQFEVQPRGVEPSDPADDEIQEATTNDLGKWGYSWRAAWDANAGDQRLERQGRLWLKAAPREQPSWGLVWTALWAQKPGEHELEALGRRWLAEQPLTREAWTYLWVALWGRFVGDPELEAKGHLWLDEMPMSHQSWPYIWRFLWQSKAGDGGLQAAGTEWLLQTSLTDRAWGIVWPPLWEADSGNKVLAGLGLRWLEVNEPDHPGWGYVWPGLWKADPRNLLLERLGRRWLSRVKFDHPAFGYIWPPLWLSNVNDSHLRVLGRMWLDEASHDNDSWGFIWQAFISIFPDDEQLLERGKKWLEKADCNNKSFGRVWELLWQKEGGNSQLKEQGLKWIESASASHGGWGFVWKELRKAYPKNQTIADAGRHWLEAAPPCHKSWHYVWKELEAADPDDEALLEAGRSWLGKAPLFHGAWSHVWEVVYAAYPGDKQLEQRGYLWLVKADPEDVHWTFMWQTLWKAKRGDPDLEREGRTWLAGPIARRRSWSYLWVALFGDRSDDPELIQLGLKWLREVCVDDRQWVNVWLSLTQRDSCKSDLLLLAQMYLKAHPLDFNWFQLWCRLSQTGQLDEGIVNLGRERGLCCFSACVRPDEETVLKHIETSSVDAMNADWTIIWREAWDYGINHKRLAIFGTYALNKAPELRQWPFIWRLMYDEIGNDQQLMEMGREWVTSTPSAVHGWGLVWAPVARNSHDPSLLPLGRPWMRPQFFRRTSWSEIWFALWDLDRGNRKHLASCGKKYLFMNRGKIDPAVQIWRILYEHEADDPRLLYWGTNFLSFDRKHPQWPDVASFMWRNKGLRPELRQIITSWITENSEHTAREKFKQLISSSQCATM